MKQRTDKIGLWMVGACGSVASTVALGVAALRKGLMARTGLVTELPIFSSSGLVPPGSLVIGGHEIRSQTVSEAVDASHEGARLFDADLIKACSGLLRATQRNIRPGTMCGAGAAMRKLASRTAGIRDRSPAAAVERLTTDITSFRRRHRLDQVVVVNVASSEPAAEKKAAHATFAKLQRVLARAGSGVLPTSSIYALAAIEAGCAFVNFTPSTGVRLPALQERAKELGVPYMGDDGKTGESLVKSVLAPMFAMRNLSVLSWIGQNILGNRDGAVLSDPKTRASKIRSKDRVVSQSVPKTATTHVSIEYVPSLDDWKVAWDFIHFEGFLGTKMSLQFTWQGSDSILAAPLIIDLTRLAAQAVCRGEAGPMTHLSFFFKDPIDVNEHDLFKQWQRLVGHTTSVPSSA